MQDGAIQKALIVLLIVILGGVCLYAAFSGTLSPGEQDQEQEQENETMISDETMDRVREVALYYDMGYDEAVEFLLGIGLREQESFMEQAKAWDRRVQEME